ncbi:MAG: hypothetical protein AAGE80_12020 [Pseudomonadota bacterium]
MPILLVSATTLPFLRVGLDLADEGYLVYGTQCLLRGQTPIRDFRAYDPGRYYWMALFALRHRATYMTVRRANVVIQTLSLMALSAAVWWATGNPWITTLSSALALIWLQPRHKQVDNFFIILGLALLAQLSPASEPGAFFAMGLSLGVSSFFGLNTFAYLVGAFALYAALFLGLPSGSDVRALALGVFVGATPVILLCLCAWDYARSYFDRKVLVLAKRGTTNLNLPHPWIWTPPQTGFLRQSPGQRLALRVLFTALPIIFAVGLVLHGLRPGQDLSSADRLALAACSLGIMTFYHALSRADLGHIYLPTLSLIALVGAGGVAVLGPTMTVVLLAFLIAGSVWLVWDRPFQPLGYFRIKDSWIPCDTPQGCFLLQPPEAAQMKGWGAVIEAETQPGAPILTVPVLVGLCALYERRHAAFDTFPIYPSSPGARAQMLEDITLSRPAVAIVSQVALDGRQDLVFSNNYPNVARYLAETFGHQEKIGNSTVFTTPRADQRSPRTMP